MGKENVDDRGARKGATLRSALPLGLELPPDSSKAACGLWRHRVLLAVVHDGALDPQVLMRICRQLCSSCS